MSNTQVQVESTGLAMVEESALGATTPPTSGWHNLQPNSYGAFASSYKKTPRDPISTNAQLQKGMLTDEDSGIAFEMDVTKDAIDRFGPGIFRCVAKHAGNNAQSQYAPTAVTTTGYTVAALGDLSQHFLIVARGFGDAANNGLKAVAAASTGTEIKTSGLVADASPPTNASVEVAGWRGAASDITMDASGNLLSTAADFTTMGLNLFQWVSIGDPNNAAVSFATAAYLGSARIRKIEAHKLTFDRRAWVVAGSDDGSGKTIDIYFSRFLRNVATKHADYRTPSYAFEVTYQTLNAGSPEYEYLLGNMVDEWKWNIPLTTKATISAKLVGTKTLNPTTSRVTGPSVALDAPTNAGVSTATDLLRLRVSNVDETGISTDFQNLTVTAANNVSPEKQLGALGATRMNIGKHTEMVEAACIFVSDDIIKAVRDNRTCSLDVMMRNGDFGALLDVQSMTIDSTDRKLERDKSVMIDSKASGFQDQNSGSTASLSVFAYLPPVVADSAM